MSDDQKSHLRPAKVQGAAAVTKGLRLLQMISELGSDANVRTLQQYSELPRPTLYRLLNTLEQEGFIERNPLGGEYVLGRQVLRLAQKSLTRSSLQSRMRGTLEAIGKATGETVHLAVPYGCHMTFIDKVESTEAVRMASYIGMPVPMHSSSVGKAYLAALNESECEHYLAKLQLDRITENTISSLDALREELGRTRERGYAISDEENEKDIICFGRVIFTVDSTPAGVISVSVPRYRLNKEVKACIIKTLSQLIKKAEA